MGKKTRAIKNISKTEARAKEATSNKSWGASGTLLQEIATDSNDYEKFPDILRIIHKRLATTEPNKDWRRVYKTLQMIDYLLKNGNVIFVKAITERMTLIKDLQTFEARDKENVDVGKNVREKSKAICRLIMDHKELQRERAKARELQQKMSGKDVPTAISHKKIGRKRSHSSPIQERKEHRQSPAEYQKNLERQRIDQEMKNQGKTKESKEANATGRQEQPNLVQQSSNPCLTAKSSAPTHPKQFNSQHSYQPPPVQEKVLPPKLEQQRSHPNLGQQLSISGSPQQHRSSRRQQHIDQKQQQQHQQQQQLQLQLQAQSQSPFQQFKMAEPQQTIKTDFADQAPWTSSAQSPQQQIAEMVRNSRKIDEFSSMSSSHELDSNADLLINFEAAAPAPKTNNNNAELFDIFSSAPVSQPEIHDTFNKSFNPFATTASVAPISASAPGAADPYAFVPQQQQTQQTQQPISAGFPNAFNDNSGSNTTWLAPTAPASNQQASNNPFDKTQLQNTAMNPQTQNLFFMN